MTLETAPKLVYRELGIWPLKCSGSNDWCSVDPSPHHCSSCSILETWELNTTAKGEWSSVEHDIPMPPLTDGLLAVILRRLGYPCVFRPVGRKWACSIGPTGLFAPLASAVTDDPLSAAVMAFAQYLEARK